MSLKTIIGGFALAVVLASNVYADLYTLDNASTEVTFLVKHEVGFSTGFLQASGGSFEIDKDALKSIKLDVSSASVDTKNERRDGLIQSEKFFDSANFPVISLNSKEVSGKNVKADFIYKSKSYPVVLNYRYLGRVDGKNEAVVLLTAKLKRADIGMSDPAQPEDATVGSEIELFITLKGNAKE